ncbi:MAG: xylulokinase [Chloroflexi bacterium HGW-Chloroflexi-10]|nr:MAG: xylulokinase [Chloroflexi bacterium HGW-Chloroflexi-10]
MSDQKYLLGIDISTTGAKALLINSQGEVLATATTALHLSMPQPLWSEQDPQEWWQGVCESVKAALTQTNLNSADICAVGLTGQMHGLVMLDENGTVLRPAILWNDQRTSAQCDQIRRLVGKERLIAITGNDALTGFTAPKILWVKENEPDVFQKCRHILLPKDYIRFRLTGEYAMDRAGGSGTILFDLEKRDWSDEILHTLEIPREWMPPTFEGTRITGSIGLQGAADTGLNAGTPVAGGGGDQAAQATGVGAVRPGVAAVTLGTSGVVFATTPAALVEPQGRLHAFCHSIPGRWHLMGVMLSAAGSLQWYRDTFAPDVSFADLVAEADFIQPGSNGLLFLPYLTGERTPHPDPLARGAWVGLTALHTRAHLTRAVLEGVAFGLRDCFELLRSAGLETITEVRISGGGARSRLWQQIIADVLNVELKTVNTTEGAAFGAALLAGVAVDVWPDVDQACSETLTITGAVQPLAENQQLYQHYYEIYKTLYPALKSINQLLSA